MRRALISCYYKAGLIELASALHAAGIEIVSTGSTATCLAASGVPVTGVEQVTGFAECLDGRVKTLHPAIHAGLLADLRRAGHRQALNDLGIEAFDLVVCNLYPFSSTVASGAGADDCVEQIDVGGPTMIRAAAKNFACVAVVVDPGQYPDIIAAVERGGFTLAERKALAVTAFAHTADYDFAVATWMSEVLAPPEDGLADWVGRGYRLVRPLRYGENPHQRAALYAGDGPGLATANQLHGKQMSYNNYVDTDAAWRAATDFADPAVAIVKHANPCGIACVPDGADQEIALAYQRALACDPVSAFGSVVAVNRPVTVALAELIADVFTEVVIAPSYRDGAVQVLARKKNLRVLAMPSGGWAEPREFRAIDGGLLVQTTDTLDAPGDDPAQWALVSGTAATAEVLADLVFAWRACRSVKSNAIVLARQTATVGVGMGQVNRLDSARLAVSRAGERASGSVGASDAFFPFPDGLQILLDAGVRAVVQPGGSVRDDDVIATAAAAGITMYFTGTRHFAH